MRELALTLATAIGAIVGWNITLWALDRFHR